LPLGEETSDVQTLGKNPLSLTEFLSKNECNDSEKKTPLLNINDCVIISTSGRLQIRMASLPK